MSGHNSDLFVQFVWCKHVRIQAESENYIKTYIKWLFAPTKIKYMDSVLTKLITIQTQINTLETWKVEPQIKQEKIYTDLRNGT